MKKIIYTLFVCAAVVFIFNGCKEEQPGSIYGTVTDKATGNPIQNAGVELQSIGKKTVTGSEGQFEFTEVEVGEYDLYVTKTGYTDVKASVVVTEGQSVQSDIQMEKLPGALRIVDDNRNDISELNFGSQESDVARGFNIFNDGTATLEWEITKTADWIATISKTSGTLNTGATQAIIVTINRSLLQSGENVTTLHITSNDGSKQLTVKAVNGTVFPTLNTLAATNVTTTTATFNGQITSAGTPSYTERGFVYATSSMPTISNNKITAAVTSNTTYNAIATGLTLGTTYYVRAYAINSAGVAYSTNQVTVIPQRVLPQVTTNSVSNIDRTNGTAVFNGNIVYVGDPAYTERGFVYGTMPVPTIGTATKRTVSGTTSGAYTYSVTGLAESVYYVRAYAINAAGTEYGSPVSFSMLPGVLCSGCGPGGVDLLVAYADAGSFTWGPTSNTTGATNQADGMINMNTIRAIDNDFSSYPAFQACANMGSNWYLPSKNELNQLYLNRAALGGFSDDYYWSSTELSSNGAWYQHFSNGNQYYYSKDYNLRVRCVRRN